MSLFSFLLLFSFRFSIYMPYSSTRILSFMDIIKHQFKGTSTVLFSEKQRNFIFAWTSTKSWMFYVFFCEADYIENVTKDVPRIKLYICCAYFESYLWSKHGVSTSAVSLHSQLQYTLLLKCHIKTGIHTSRIGLHAVEKNL